LNAPEFETWQAVVTDAQGRFRFQGLAAGTYQPAADLPAGLVVVIPPVTGTIDRGAVAGLGVTQATEPTSISLYIPLMKR
jgi:hypothetical protein